MSANGDVTDCIVLGSDTDSDVALHRSAPVSPTQSLSTWRAGLQHAGGVGRIERSVDEAWRRRLPAGPVRLPHSWPPAADGTAATPPPAQHLQTQITLGADISMQDCNSPAMHSQSPLPLRERLRQRADPGQYSCVASHSKPTHSLAGLCSNACRGFCEPATALMGRSCWQPQDTQPSSQALAGLEKHSALGSEELREYNNCISLVTP